MKFPIAGLLLGALCALIGGSGLVLIALTILRQVQRGRAIGLDDVGAFAVLMLISALFAAYGVKLITRSLQAHREAIEERRTRPSEAELAARPWLRHVPWRQREVLFSSPVRDSVLVLAYLFFGPPALGFLWVAIANPVMTYTGEHVSVHDRVSALVYGALLAFVVGGLTYWRLRRARYGTSVCRLRTLPGVVGGQLDADVDCALPAAGGDEVVVRLRNLVPRGRRFKEVWRMEERVTVPVTPGSRAMVPVRLRVPRDGGQQPMKASGSGLEWYPVGQPSWMLEVEKKVPGINFFAAFQVPVYEPGDVPADGDAAA